MCGQRVSNINKITDWQGKKKTSEEKQEWGRKKNMKMSKKDLNSNKARQKLFKIC